MARLVLVGMPGVGKTTIAQVLADHWNCTALDTDEMIAAMVGTAPADLLRAEGEIAFREHEADALEEALNGDGVVSTGGGIITTPKARALLKDEVTFWLDCSDAVIIPRLVGSDRPLLDGDPTGSLASLRAQREQWYREVSRAQIDASGTVEDVIVRVIEEVAKAAK